MNIESGPRKETPEEENERLTREYADMLAQYEDAPVPAEKREECGPSIEAFLDLCGLFEAKHDLAALHAITHLTIAEGAVHPVWTPAMLDLAHIVGLLNHLKDETDISEEKLQELKARYKKLTQAVGMITEAGIVDHTR